MCIHVDVVSTMGTCSTAVHCMHVFPRAVHAADVLWLSSTYYGRMMAVSIYLATYIRMCMYNVEVPGIQETARKTKKKVFACLRSVGSPHAHKNAVSENFF